jgi:ABC-type Fe3+-hydroxamate transport system substrate-binding protein
MWSARLRFSGQPQALGGGKRYIPHMNSDPIKRLRTTSLLVCALAACAQDPMPIAPATGAIRPIRVVPTNATAVDIVFDLAGPERIIALPNTVGDYATVDLDFSRWGDEFLFNEFTAEVMLAYDPDLVVVSPWQDQHTINRLIESGIRVLELPVVDDLEDIRFAITTTGEALGEVDTAEDLLAEFDRRATALQEAAAKRGEVSGLVYTNYGSGGWAAGTGTTAHHMLQLAGLVNVAAESGRSGHDGVNIEAMLDFAPDVLVISQPSVYYGVTRNVLESEKGLATLEAIVKDRIIELPSGLFSTASHHLLDAAELLAKEVDGLLESGRLDLK